MSGLTVGEILILTVWVVSAFALNHAVKKDLYKQPEGRGLKKRLKRETYLPSKEDKENIVETFVQFIWQTPEELLYNWSYLLA